MDSKAELGVTGVRRGVSHAFLGDTRAIVRRIGALLETHPQFKPRYDAAKRVVRAFRKPAFYEIAQRCNLRCEGCYYFEGGISRPVQEAQPIAAWEAFFAAEAARGVTMAYFVGAEPALEQERLVAASSRFPYGNIGTNGTIRIDPCVPYRIGVSVWAGEDGTDRALRGASAFRKAFRNYAGDPRVNILFTISRWNLRNVRTVAEMCRDNGLPLTFNLYSPTLTFLDKLQRRKANDDAYFRISRPHNTPVLRDDDLMLVRRTISDLMDEFPDTILYAKAYNTWVTQPGSLYEIDPQTGIATHCGSRIIGTMRYYGADLQPRSPKCCTSDVDCSQCRMYSGGWSSKFQPGERDVADAGAFADWLDMITVLGRIFLYEQPGRVPLAHREARDLLIAAETAAGGERPVTSTGFAARLRSWPAASG